MGLAQKNLSSPTWGIRAAIVRSSGFAEMKTAA
jgi:hypothetical protein